MINHEYIDPLRCSVDPITLTGLALGALAGGGAALATSGGGSAPTAPTAPPPMAAPASAPTGNRPKNVSQTPTFVGSSAAPDQRGFGSSTLLGQ